MATIRVITVVVTPCMVLQHDPSLIPSSFNQFNYDHLDDSFLLITAPDIFNIVADKVSVMCAFIIGRLLKNLKR